MRKINVAILGAGNIARDMADAINGIPNEACLYAVASRSLEKASDFAKKYGALNAYGSYEELAGDNNVDLVYIATPHSEHYKNTKLCLEAGRNCLVEKAFCANLGQSRELIDLARKNNLLLCEAMWTRFQPSSKIIMNELLSGIIGNARSLIDDFSISARGVERLEKPELCGGALLDLGIYSLTTSVIFFGTDIKSIKTNAILNEFGVDLTEKIILRYKDGKEATVKASFGSDFSNFARITGDKGYMEFAPINAPTYLKIYDLESKLIKSIELPLIVNGYEYEVLECRDAIINGNLETKSMPHSETLRMMGWMDSIREHIGVRYPFEKDEDRVHKDEDVWGINNVFEE